MIYPVTPWSATVQEDIAAAESLAATQLANYEIAFYNAGDSIWLTVKWPEGGRIAFRLAFGMNSDFEKISITPIDDGLLVTANTRLGSYRITVSFPDSDYPVLRYTTTFRAAFEMLIPYWPRDIVPLPADGRIENTAGKIHAQQEGGRSGLIFFSYMRPKTGSVFYFQNLTAMSAYCDASETTLYGRVGGQWPEIGFQFPVNKDKPLPAGVEYIISDAFVLLNDVIPEKDYDVAGQFIDYLAAIYLLLPKPEPQYQDWPTIASKALADLKENKGCWTQIDGIPYLNAYVGDHKTPAEIMVQLAVLLPLMEYLGWTGEKDKLTDELNSGLEKFYDGEVKSIVRWHPARRDDLDGSEEQKREHVMDSWYLHHPLLNLARLALKGDGVAKKIFLDSLDFAIKVAHHFNYDWPVFYKMTTLEVIKAETAPGKGGERDVPGSYAHVLLLAWRLTGEKRYWNEAIKAVKKLDGLAFDIFYQANNTAFTAGALVELYNETKDEFYLKLSYCSLAGILRNVQLWDCGYGVSKAFPNFFAVFPLNDAPYTAAYEELEVYAAVHHYLNMTRKVTIPPSLRLLLTEFIKYTPARLAYYYPPLLPDEMISDEVKTGEIKKDLWIPLEDIHDGHEKSGSVGQEVYGAGVPFGIVPRQYHKFRDGDAILYSDYPVAHLRQLKRSVTFRIDGLPHMSCKIRILGVGKKALADYRVAMKTKADYIAVPHEKSEPNVYTVFGGALVSIKW
jgi:hypothetical protein